MSGCRRIKRLPVYTRLRMPSGPYIQWRTFNGVRIQWGPFNGVFNAGLQWGHGSSSSMGSDSILQWGHILQWGQTPLILNFSRTFNGVTYIQWGTSIQWGQTPLILNFSDFRSPPLALGSTRLSSCFCIRCLNRSLPRTHALFVASRIASRLLSGRRCLKSRR